MTKIYIADLDENLILVTDYQDAQAVRETIPEAKDYDSFFVRVEDGDYAEVYGFEGTVPYLHKEVVELI